MVQKPNIDIKNLKDQVMGSPWVNELSQHLNGYEQKLKSVVKDLDLKGRDAREKSRKQLDSFTKQIVKTRSELEKRVRSLVKEERKRLNDGFNDLVTYLRSLASMDSVSAKPKGKATKKAAAPVAKKKAGTKKPDAARRSVSTGKKSVSVKSSKSSEHQSSLPV